ncbi:LlaJI family restriction endonuclease [Citrobacter koseri]|uniref:LlaJI family restriction endonuclease n=1 Tax=Citrobacter koseri TaxID=545 RepID=UPI00388FA194
MSLLEDFNLNGLYKRRSKRKVYNTGKINWKKTIHGFQPYPSDNSPLYLEYEGISKRTELDSEISKIHAGIIYDISKDLGWLTYSEPAYYESVLNSIGRSELSEEIQIATIKKELDTIYSERDIYLLKSISNYLEKTLDMTSQILLLVLKSFMGCGKAFSVQF